MHSFLSRFARGKELSITFQDSKSMAVQLLEHSENAIRVTAKKAGHESSELLIPFTAIKYVVDASPKG